MTSFTITFRGDQRFVDTVRLLTARTAETAGCAPAEATGLAEAVARVLAALGGGTNEATRNGLHVRFDDAGEALRVEIAAPLDIGATKSMILEALGAIASDAQIDMSGNHQVCRFICRHPPQER
jgi:hypothetical protein